MFFAKYLIIFSVLLSSFANAQIGRRISTVTYSHSSVGTTAQDAIAPASVVSNVTGWKICHDAGSSNDYIAVSSGLDPGTDGVRIGIGFCYDCRECNSTTLIDVNIKGSAAATGYSVIQYK